MTLLAIFETNLQLKTHNMLNRSIFFCFFLYMKLKQDWVNLKLCCCRTKVYSGNKAIYTKVPTLFDICSRVLQDNLDGMFIVFFFCKTWKHCLFQLWSTLEGFPTLFWNTFWKGPIRISCTSSNFTIPTWSKIRTNCGSCIAKRCNILMFPRGCINFNSRLLWENRNSVTRSGKKWKRGGTCTCDVWTSAMPDWRR